jgi:hypothetical protein
MFYADGARKRQEVGAERHELEMESLLYMSFSFDIRLRHCNGLWR